MARPIWKDYPITLGSSDYHDYIVQTGGATIYSGRAYKRPGADSVVIKINDIAADYIAAVLPRLNDAYTNMQNAAAFVVKVGSTTKASVTFYNDWSYDDTFDSSLMPLADPVTGIIDPRQLLFFSVLPGVSSLNATIYFANGTSSVVPLTIYSSGDFNGDFNTDFNVAGSGEGGTAILDLSTYTNPKPVRVVISNVDYYVKQDCREYAAYYVNAYGGWDTLVLDGYTSLRDDLVRFTMQQDYDNRDGSMRGRKDYAIEVTPAWTLRTGWLSDEESLRMHHLLNSPEVYLCELSTRKFTPVLLTDMQYDRKTFKGNGRQVNMYSFNAALAQQRFRR